MSRITLTDLDAVMAIARRGTFRAAAIELGVSTTALSHIIAKFEAEMGVRLFNRTTRSVGLTDAGRLFIDNIGPSLQGVHQALEVVRSRSETPSGVLRINTPPFAARALLSRVVLEFLRRYPQMQVDIVTDGRLIDIVAEGFDMGVRVASLIPEDMIALSLGQPQRYAVVASAHYLSHHKRPETPTDLLNHPCIRVRLPDGSLYRWHLEKQGETVQVDVRGQLTLDEASLARIAVLEHAGIGFFLEQDVIEDIQAGRLIRLLDDWTPPFPGLCLYYPGRRHPSAGLAAFLALAREFAQSASR
ncbi:LysR family transcriptional regulator [Raoultella planticola]|uniref:LysR family transcriptional regulator n=1 Tax=Raoultella planticola TaxID=575 RepID=UPI00066DB65A|nr:LysR family transcriptional regulator [Raoultella planticola]MCQ6501364.1 LysR family transcriptional regulator [Raoultella planticola]TQN56162.1 LysR family transcriptional regulator [Raoultella planticola]HBC8114627.1 LysR family transcriptional regulator [Raoultella planticola]